MKYSNEYKLMCIEMYYRGKYPETPEGMTLKKFHQRIREWARKSERGGLESVKHKAQNKKWTPEERLALVEKVLAGSAVRAAAEEELKTHNCNPCCQFFNFSFPGCCSRYHCGNCDIH